MAEPAGPFHVLRTRTGRFLCYCGPDGTVYVTDAMEVWAGELGGCPALGFRCPPEDLGAMLSPEKNAARSQQLFLPDPSPRKSKASGSALPAKRKVPGESLINPGFKRSVLGLDAARWAPCGLCSEVTGQQGLGLVTLMFPPSPSSKKAPSGVNFEDS
ncbi:protein PAXX isoform X8 [Vidua chalybeata]|uniref:protein PAXX isoform X8 n=1 Tax=Vidua chalybeata TaxID=81927 RepID=UPI0023A8A078|nr:protein PAXX isoform X8 [Vidua chalybeata]